MTNLRTIRMKKGYSQVEVAKELGISKQAYGKYELGKSEASYETLLKLAEFFDTTVEEIIREPENETYKMPDSSKTLTNQEYMMPDSLKKITANDNTLRGLELDVSGLSDKDIEEVEHFIDLLRQKNQSSDSEG